MKVIKFLNVLRQANIIRVFVIFHHIVFSQCLSIFLE